MLNFTSVNGSSIGFEVNRYNMINEKLKLSSDIMVLGGTELDIAQLLREMEQEMAHTQTQLIQQADKLKDIEQQVTRRERQLSTQANELGKLKSEVLKKESEILSQKKRLAQQNQEIVQQSKEITKQSEDLKQQAETLRERTSKLQNIQKELKELDEALLANRSEMAQSSKELSEKRLEISSKESFIKELSALINKNKQLLSEQKAHIASQANAISEQQDNIALQSQEIESQSDKIQQQNIFLIISLVILTLVLMLIAVIQKSARATKRANANLAAANEELELTNKLLNDTQGQLVESEKMAALGGLVAGVAHEINTPLGVSVTAATHLSESISTFIKQYKSGSLKRTELESMLDDAEEATTIINRNLERASTLVGNFKQIAADQTVEDIREFSLNHYFEEISQSLSPQLKKKHHQIDIQCSDELTLYSYPGAIAQVFTNLVMNSVIHGFEDISGGQISIIVKQEGENIFIRYQDNGSGINEEQRSKVFDPFYTTKRSEGGTGLGMHICYNLVTQKLRGSISCLANDGGALFELSLPRSIKTSSDSEQNMQP